MAKTSEREIEKFFSRLQEYRKDAIVNARLGNLLTGALKDGNRFYATLVNGQVVKVVNNKVPAVFRWPVRIGYTPGSHLLQVLETWNVFDELPQPDIVSHADTHQWPGSDTLYSRGEQILPGLFVPTTGLTLAAYAFVYYLASTDGVYHLLPNQFIDFAAEVPVSGAKYVLLEVNEDRDLQFISGTSVLTRDILRAEDIPAPSVGWHPLIAVKMYEGQTSWIFSETDTDITDLRWAGYTGQAVAIDWDDILSKPTVFNPDLTVTDPRYPRIFPALVPPTASDDNTLDYKVGDFIIDTVLGVAYQAIDVSTDAAIWFSASAVAGSGAVGLVIDGALAVVDTAAPAIMLTADTTVSTWYFRLKNRGTSGSSIFDLILTRDGVDTSILQDVYDDNRAVIAYDDANGWVKVTVPLITDFIEGDVITPNIDQVAPGASTLTVTSNGISGGAIGFNLTVEAVGGSPSISHVGKIVVPADKLQDNGGGEVELLLPDGLEKIEDVIVAGSSAADMTFSTIPTGYKYFVLFVFGRSTGAGSGTTQVKMQFNADTGNNYSFSRWNRFGSNNQATIGYIELGGIPLTSATANRGHGIEMKIFGPTNTTWNKAIVAISQNVTDLTFENISAGWANTAAISAIKLFLTSGNWEIGSYATLCGVK